MYQPTTTRPPPPPPCRHNSLQIEISGIPAENGKCRVETQLKIALHLKNAQNESVKEWKQLRLPHSLIAKEKHRMEKFNGRSKHIEDSEILTLDARLVCDHDMTKILECCDNCIGRERKRAHRRKESQKLPGPLSSIPIFGSINPKNGPVSLADEPIPPTPTDPTEYQAWERHRIMVFSSTEYVDISSGQCLLPTRITCYCRHHNEKVGFRIQFTAKDSTGAVVASVLSNAVMMMDDHKSGKRPTAGAAKSTSSTAVRKRAATTGTSNGATAAGSTENQDDGDQDEQQNDDDDDQEDMDQDDVGQGDGDEIDLEAGRHIHQHGFAANGMKFEDAEMASGDILTPLSSAAERLGAKRRVVDENAMEGVQAQSDVDPSRGPFRRKTSHDIPQGIGAPASFVSSSHSFATSLPTDSLLSPSPFMPGSPFANDSQHNAFSPSFSQALDGSFLDQKNIDMFLSTGLPPSLTQQNGFHKFSKDTSESESSMMEFTTLDEAMGSPPDAFQASTLSTDSISTTQPSEQASHSTATTATTSVQNQSKLQMEAKPVPWTTNKAENKDPYWKMRMAMSQTTSPSSSAFIPIPTSLPEDGDKAATPKPSPDTNATEISTPTADAPLAPKKRGRPRKAAAPTASEASSPVLSALPPSPTPSVASLAPPSTAAASAAAAQFLLFQQRQQQQLQHHQQQLQQQQKQAILARQKPRVQKLIPSRGPVEGGVEITLLGSGFFPGMVPTFDGVPAQNVQYYGPET
ncbi:SPT3 Dosage dependent suppressor of Ty-induced promoter mutations-like protein, partial [Linnemannia elongata]